MHSCNVLDHRSLAAESKSASEDALAELLPGGAAIQQARSEHVSTPSSDPSASTVPEEIQAAWERDRRCAHCGEPLAWAADAALLIATQRITHRLRCFVPALLRQHPYLRLLSAHPGAEEVRNASPDRSGDRVERHAARTGHRHAEARG